MGPPHIHPKKYRTLEKLFGDNLIQNAPYSPDIAYPLKNLDKFKLITIKEWNKIQKSFTRKLQKYFIKRCKCHRIKWRPLELVHLKLKRKEAEDEEKKPNAKYKIKKEKKTLNIVKLKNFKNYL